MLEAAYAAGRELRLELKPGDSTGLYIVSGQVSVNSESASATELVVLERRGGELTLQAGSDALVFVMNGTPLDEPVAGYGPFVMNTPKEIQQAFADFHAGRLGSVPTSRETLA